MAIQLDNLTEFPSGYAKDDTFFASRYQQGTRCVFAVDLALADVAALLPRPDPSAPNPANRQIIPRHAEDFGNYVREKREWVSPALLVRAPENVIGFEEKAQAGGSAFGIISIPRLARTELRILDGQHRILGIHMAMEGIARDLDKARQDLATARTSSPDEVARYENTVKNLLLQRDRCGRERISVQIVIGDLEKDFKQMFVDIAENAKGITKTIQSRFDSRKVVNRALPQVIEHPLLLNRTEDQLDRVKSDQQFLAAKHVAEVIRAVAVGVGGRVSKKKEEELDESELVSSSDRFLTILCRAFPDLQAVADGTLEPGELRGNGPRGSLLGSATMLRVLAGAYRELSHPTPRRGEETPAPMTDAEVIDFFSELRPNMAAPVTSSLWIDTKLVEENAHAPRARGGDIRRLANLIVGWARHGVPEPEV